MVADKQIQISLHIRRQVLINGTLIDYHDVIHLPDQPVDFDVFMNAVSNGTLNQLFNFSKAELSTKIQNRVAAWKDAVINSGKQIEVAPPIVEVNPLVSPPVGNV